MRRTEKGSRLRIVALIVLPLFMAGCAETQLVIHGAKQISGSPTAKSKGSYKVGNPYQIKSTWYYPAEDYDYVETGIASWYGPNFHGKQTANGGTFDMNELTAAHRTLPMPSMVRVTNLVNGRVLMLRVTDRGPFARGRIIDVSRRGAQLLGFQKQGTARVRVEVIADESRRLKQLALAGKVPPNERIAGTAVPTQLVQARPLEATPIPNEQVVAQGTVTRDSPVQQAALPTVSRAAVNPASDIFVQAGAFSDPGNAARVESMLNRFGSTQVQETQVGQKRLFRVRLGPMASVQTADNVLGRVINAGFPNARIVVD